MSWYPETSLESLELRKDPNDLMSWKNNSDFCIDTGHRETKGKAGRKVRSSRKNKPLLGKTWWWFDWDGRRGGVAAAAAAKSLQSCPTLCDPIDGSPPGSPVHGILQARTVEWVAISFSNAWKWKVKVKSLSSVRLLATPWTAAHQAPPSMGFSRQEYWSGVPLPSLDMWLTAIILTVQL